MLTYNVKIVLEDDKLLYYCIVERRCICKWTDRGLSFPAECKVFLPETVAVKVAVSET